MTKTPRVILKWQYPRQIDYIFYDKQIYEKGIYFISRKFGKNNTPLYIGKTYDCFYNRLSNHLANEKFTNYRGKILVRLGIIDSPKNIIYEEMKDIIDDIEKGLIYEMRNVLPLNTMSVNSYTVKKFYIIVNTGYRGVLPTRIYMRKHTE